MAWQCILPEVTVKGFSSAAYPVPWMGLMMICSGVAVKRMGMLGVSVREMKVLTLIGRGR
jgi:hypothetical protein